MNLPTFLVLVLLLLVVAGAVVLIVRNKRKGKSACGHDCENCSGKC